jgi:PAS domain S-box-containing protein
METTHDGQATDGRETDEAVRRNRDLLRRFVENAPVALSLLDRDMRYLAVSGLWTASYGMTSAEVAGRSHYEIFPTAPERWRDVHRRCLQGEIVRSEEDSLVRADGGRVWVQWEVRPWFIAADIVGGTMVFSQDISARKEAAAIQARLNRALRLLKECSVTILRAEDEQKLLDDVCRLFVEIGGYVMAWVGAAVEDPEKSIRILARSGYEEGYLDGIRLSWDGTVDIGRGPTGTALRTGLTQINQNHVTNPAVAPWRSSAGRRGYRASIALPLRHQHFSIGVLTTYAAEPNVFTPDEVELLQELADTVAFGVQSLRTRRQRDAAVAATQAKSDFLSSMSHELRTPLNAILGFAQLLQNSPSASLTERQAGYVEHIRKGGRHLLQLINEILDLARIETGRLSLSPEAVEIRPLLQEVLSATRAYAGSTAIQVEDWRIAPTIPEWVLSDRLRLKQVLLNLTSNAVKYNSPSGAVRLEIAASGEGHVRFAVADDGPGIDESKRHYLFEPFHRLGAEATDIEGTGVGLTISKQLVEAMGGRIGFETEVGRGSTFWIDVPAVAAMADRAPVGDRPSQRLADLTGMERKTLLYVEDNPANLQLMRDIVDDLSGFALLTATAAEQGIEIARTTPPDIIVLDINLPGISGIEAAVMLRADPRTAHIPIVALSADATDRTIRKGKEAGIDRYLTKPLEIADFLAVIRELAGGRA